jgi:hypothetical protein
MNIDIRQIAKKAVALAAKRKKTTAPTTPLNRAQRRKIDALARRSLFNGRGKLRVT